jgi:hypothetical protein
MTELPNHPEATSHKLAATKHYRIRKELVCLFSLGVVVALLYPIYDGIKHVNWPPHDVDPVNQKFIATLNCKQLSTEPIPKFPSAFGTTVELGGTDRNYFFAQPQCAVIPYLSYEGSGARIGYTIYNAKNNQPLAIHIFIA